MRRYRLLRGTARESDHTPELVVGPPVDLAIRRDAVQQARTVRSDPQREFLVAASALRAAFRPDRADESALAKELRKLSDVTENVERHVYRAARAEVIHQPPLSVHDVAQQRLAANGVFVRLAVRSRRLDSVLREHIEERIAILDEDVPPALQVVDLGEDAAVFRVLRRHAHVLPGEFDGFGDMHRLRAGEDRVAMEMVAQVDLAHG